MSYRVASLRMGMIVAVLVACGPRFCTAQTGSRQGGKNIEFSDPKSGDLTTNLYQLRSKKDSLKQWEEDLSKSMGTGANAAVPDELPPMAPSARPVVPNKRLKELMERRKFEFLLTPEDLAHTPTLREMLDVPEYGPDGMEQKPKSPLERYYERNDSKRTGAGKSIRSQDEETSGLGDALVSRDGSGGAEDSRLPAGLQGKQQVLRRLLEPETTANQLAPVAPNRSAFSDIFGLGQVTPTPESTLENKNYMERYTSILEPIRLPQVAADAPKLPGTGSDSTRPLASPFGVPDTSSDPLGTVNPIFTPTSPQTVKSIDRPTQSPLLPKPESVRPAAPSFAAPVRPPI